MLFPPLTDETSRVLLRLPEIIDNAFPLPARYRQELKHDVAELSRLLTSGRKERSGSYLGKPAMLSAYLRYFLPWNIYRLCRLLSSLPFSLKARDCVNDLGAGPLTFAASLWISRPELRSVPLEFRCVDRTAAVLEAGKEFFNALVTAVPAAPMAMPPACGETGNSAACSWKIKTIRGELKRNGALSVEIRGEPAALSASVNLYNELFWDFSPADSAGIEHFADKQARLLSSLTDSSGSIFVMEPGIPRSGEFISLLRSGLVKEGRQLLSPCPHRGACPFTTHRAGYSKAKWCHFAFDTEDAPAELHKLSAAAKIPKERAVLSFIFAGPACSEKLPQGRSVLSGHVKIRIISDSFPVNIQEKKHTMKDNWGRYGCSERGLVLVTGSKEELARLPSGALEELPLLEGKIDEKSGALMAPIFRHHFR